MQRSRSPGSRLALIMLILITGCSGFSSKPNWKALYAQKLGQPVVELHEASLNQAFQDSQGNLTRVSWARLDDGTTVLFGLPAYQDQPQHVVDRTVILSQTRWQDACQGAVSKQITGWGWNIASNAVTNQMNINVSTKHIGGTRSIEMPDPTEPTCQFIFLPEGWRLRLVHDKGEIKT